MQRLLRQKLLKQRKKRKNSFETEGGELLSALTPFCITIYKKIRKYCYTKTNKINIKEEFLNDYS